METEGIILMIKDIYQIYTTNIEPEGKIFPLRPRERCLVSPPLYIIVLVVLVGVIMQNKYICAYTHACVPTYWHAYVYIDTFFKDQGFKWNI